MLASASARSPLPIFAVHASKSAHCDKAEFERRAAWYMLVSGGPTRTFAVFAPRASMADMALPQVSMIEALEKAIGRGPANTAMDSLNDAIESGETELLEFRQDLSYLPQPTS